MKRSMVWFPLVGAVTGLITGYAYRWLSPVFPGAIPAVLTMVLYILLTRGLHLDGFMDTIDGFFSHRGKERILVIMKDPASGAFAVLGAMLWCLLLYSALPFLGPAEHVLIHTCGRTAILVMPLLVSYPRESGTGKFFVENVTAKIFFPALLPAVTVIGGLYFARVPGKVAGLFGLHPLLMYGFFLIAAFLLAAWIAFWARKKIDGITGDVLGFTVEIIHLVLALCVTVLGTVVSSQ